MTQHPAAMPVIVPDGEFDRPTCLKLLAGRALGRLVFTRQALPAVRPVHYQLDGEEIMIKVPVNTTASRSSRDLVVAFTVDEFDSGSQTGWSVTAVGHAHEIHQPEARLEAIASGLTSWQEDGQVSLLSITTEKLSGRRLVAMP